MTVLHHAAAALLIGVSAVALIVGTVHELTSHRKDNHR